MRIGTCITLLVVGGILTFAIHADLGALNLNVVGIILMLAGVFGLVLDFTVLAPRRRRRISSAPSDPTRNYTTADDF